MMPMSGSRMAGGTAALLLATSMLAGCATTPAAPVQRATADPLASGFADPPQSARPRVWWHWLNGNVTQDGIARDLAWMKRVGLGGVQNFDASLGTPQIVDKRLVYMTPEWKAAFRFAVAEADRHDLEFAIAASPGWSVTGGPWVKPEDGMKKLVWSETIVPGGTRYRGTPQALPNATGPYQGIAFSDPLAMGPGAKTLPQAGGGIAVIAVPVGAAVLPTPRLTLGSGAAFDGARAMDGDFATSQAMPLGAGFSGELRIGYPRPVTVRSAQLFVPGLKRPFRDAPLIPVLEAETAQGWTQLAKFHATEVPTTAGFAPVTARNFRLRMIANPAGTGGDLDSPVEGAEAFDIFALGKIDKIDIAELNLSGEPRLDLIEDKAGFGTLPDYYAADSSGNPAPDIDPARVIDLSDRVAADGSIDWTPPAGGDWRIYRFGWSLTGKTNHPATPEATGLEVDKLDPGAVERYLETYLKMYRDALGVSGPGLGGLDAILTDSIEVGAANWTPAMAREFQSRRGYALRPWLPALAGAVIGSPARTERFLYDYRRTQAEMLSDHHYGTIAKVSRRHGLKVYGEALENGRPSLGDDLAMRSHADVPMAAMWTFGRDGNPRWSLVGDMKGAASVAHVYGRKQVAAESMTSANAPWAFAPRDLKRIIDFEFLHGINLPVIHTSVHVPVEDKKPGLSLMIFGQHFNRNESWAEMAGPWVDYMSRSSYLLQQGRDYADVAVFYGEEAPLTALFAKGVPNGLPQGYAYDFVNAPMLADALRVENGMIVSSGGARYRALQLAGSSARMTLPTLRRIAALAEAGAVIVGRKPVASPSLQDDPAVFAALADTVWAMPSVVGSGDIVAALTARGVVPDFAFAGGNTDADVRFVHRAVEGGDLYFVNNRRNRVERGEARFRVTGKAPELWDAITGEARPLSYRVEGSVTVVPLDLTAEDAKFVVFREPAVIETRSVAAFTPKVVARIDGAWTVDFPAGLGAPASIRLDRLQSLSDHALPGVRYFSGVSTWRTNFAAPKRRADKLWLDLGQVGDVAEVFINGQRAGITWFAPDRVEISRLIVPGQNRLEVRVANKWVNRLIGDKQPGAEKVTFTAAPTYRADAPLRPAGLIGPVSILTAE